LECWNYAAYVSDWVKFNSMPLRIEPPAGDRWHEQTVSRVRHRLASADAEAI
jgi:hypothetical protein